MDAFANMDARQRIAVVGGGITGLAAAHRLLELSPQARVKLFDAGERLGGVLQTERHDGYLVELSADNFITNVPWGVDLCRRLGLEEELLRTRKAQRRAFVVRRGRLVPMPMGFHLLAPSRFWPIVRSPLLSWPGKFRLLCEPFIRRRQEIGDESLASFARRRLGREAFERIVQPLVAGIYTADAERLSMAAALPRFVDMERQSGSLLRAAWQSRQADGEVASGARYGLFVAPREGMSSLVDALWRRLDEQGTERGGKVSELARGDDRWSITSADQSESFDAVILAVPAHAAAGLTQKIDGELAGRLAEIPYAGSAIVVAAYARERLAGELEGFGFVVPAVERRHILAASFSSSKFDGRAPDGCMLIRAFLGGAEHPEQLELDDATLVELAQADLSDLLGLRCAPGFTRVARWPRSMPQYHVGHLELVQQIEKIAAQWPTLALAGNAYHGVGIPNCIHSAERAAERILAARLK